MHQLLQLGTRSLLLVTRQFLGTQILLPKLIAMIRSAEANTDPHNSPRVKFNILTFNHCMSKIYLFRAVADKFIYESKKLPLRVDGLQTLSSGSQKSDKCGFAGSSLKQREVVFFIILHMHLANLSNGLLVVCWNGKELG